MLPDPSVHPKHPRHPSWLPLTFTQGLAEQINHFPSMMGHPCLYGMPVHSLKLLGEKSPWPLGKEAFPGNSRNSPTFRRSPFGTNISDHQCPQVSVVTLSHFLPAGKRQKGSRCSSAPKFVNATAVPLRLWFLFTSFNACSGLADACGCHRPPLSAERSCRQCYRSVEHKAAVERRDAESTWVINLVCEGFTAA